MQPCNLRRVQPHTSNNELSFGAEYTVNTVPGTNHIISHNPFNNSLRQEVQKDMQLTNQHRRLIEMQTFQIIQRTTHCQRKGVRGGDEARADAWVLLCTHPFISPLLFCGQCPISFHQTTREETNRSRN